MKGAFQTSRELFANPIWKNIVEFRLFFLIYGNAVFTEKGVRLADDLVLKRGEWCRSTRKLQEDLQYIENRQVKTYSTSVINRCIKKLEKSQRIRTRIHELGTVFTVINYEQYQGFGGTKVQNLEQDLEHSGNSVGTLEEQQRNNNKNVKNVENEKNVVEDTTEPDDFRKIEKAYCEIHKTFGMKPKDWPLVENLLREGVDPDLIIEVMKERHAKKVKEGGTVNSFSFYINAINERFERQEGESGRLDFLDDL